MNEPQPEKNNLALASYAKFSLILLSICLLLLLLIVGKHILIPIFLALLCAIILRPIEVFINRKFKIPHVLSILITVAIFFAIITGIIFFISWQIAHVTDDWNEIQTNLKSHFFKVQNWIRTEYNISFKNQQDYLDSASTDLLESNSNIMGSTLMSFSHVLFNAVLIPIYIFLILLYKGIFINFLYKIVSLENQKTLHEVLFEVKAVIRSYILGLLIQMVIVASLTIGGLLILGVEYALVLGIITAVLNLIPYIGILIATIATLLATLVSSDSLSLVFGVIVLSIIVQFIDNNILTPRIVGNKVKINALVSIIGVIIGAAIAGIAGMFLAIPLIAIIKVTFDRVESLAHFGYLMGSDIDKSYQWGKFKIFRSLSQDEEST